MDEHGGTQPNGRGSGKSEPSVDANELIEFVRALLKRAHERTSLKFIYQLAAASGYTLQTKEETLRKFLREDGRGFDNKDDLLRLARIFTTTLIGSALVAPLRTTQTAHNDAEIRHRFIEELLRTADSANLNLGKRYLVYHSGFFESENYAIRFLKIHSNHITKQISFEDSKMDRGPLRVMEGSVHFINYGIVQFFMGKPHFISTDTFSDVGSRLIVIDRWVVDKGIAQTLIGRMSGMSNVGTSYIKDVLLHKWDGDDYEGQLQSGNLPKSSLSAGHRARFIDLARMRPGDLPDHALDGMLDRHD